MENQDDLARRPRRRLHWLERLLWAVGLLGIGWFLAVQVESRIYQAREEAALESVLAGGDAAPRRPVAGRDGAVPAGGGLGGGETTSSPLDAPPPGSALGRIEIPRLGLSAIVADGIDNRTLRRAVGHIPATARPGEPGNVGLAAHRDRFFRDLRNVEEDDEIVITTPDGVFRYLVTWTQVVEPSAVEVLTRTTKPVLTLVTCYPFRYVGPAPQRFIVRARQVGHEPAATAP